MSKKIEQCLKKTWILHVFFLSMLMSPIFFVQVFNDEDSQHWKKTMDFEFKSLQDNNIWKCIHFPTNHKWISCKWIFKINIMSMVLCQDTRFVWWPMDLHKLNIDLKDLFSLIARVESIWIVLTITTITDFKVHQMDVQTTFLNVNC